MLTECGTTCPDYISANRHDTRDYISGFRNKSQSAGPAVEAAPEDQGGPDYISAFRPQKAAPVPGVPQQYMVGDIPFNEADFKKPPPNPEAKTELQKFREAIDPINGLKTAASTVLDKAAQSWGSAVEQVSNPNLGPTFETFPSKVTTLAGNEEPATGFRMKDPGKALGVLGGIAGVPLAPLSAAELGIASATGNPDFAGKVVDLTSLGRLGKIVNEVRPATKALQRRG